MIASASKILGDCNHRIFLIKWFNMKSSHCFVCLRENAACMSNHKIIAVNPSKGVVWRTNSYVHSVPH